MSLELLQDIHLSDEEFWIEFQYYWSRKNYNKAIQVLQNNQNLITKYVNDEWFNALTDLIYQLEIAPDNLNKKQITVSYLPPDLETGDIWFQLNVGEININAYMNFIFPNSTSVSVNYNDSLIEAIAFKNNEVVLIDQIIDETNNTVTFSLGEAIDNTVVCMVYSTDNPNVVINNTSVSIGVNSFQMGYSGSLLSTMYLDALNHRQLTNLVIQDSSVNFSLSENTTALTYGRVVYIPTSYLSNILNSSTSTFSTTNFVLVCAGYLVGSFIKNYTTKEVVLGNLNLVLQNLIINVPQNSNTSLQCDIYYT